MLERTVTLDKVPYLWNPTNKTFISYDDPQSMAEKAKYIKAKGLGGGMIWEITEDDSTYSLLNALNSNM